jgi:N-dimethylarginine dimethylaminohydrolase
MRPHFLMTDPAHYAVTYRINPWMRPDAWTADAPALRRAAAAASRALARAIQRLGAEVSWVPPAPGLPDLVFPANAGVALDGKVVAARFRKPERRGEEPLFSAAFERLKAAGLVDEVIALPPGLFHEGAGDAHWDRSRGLLWTGHGPRSSRQAADVLAEVFAIETVPLELASERFYHLDTCFCPLADGAVLYYPPAFTPDSLAAIRARIAPADRIEASDEDAAAFCVNAISLGDTLVMARAPTALRRRLEARGLAVVELDLDPFILSGGAAFCMTLRLDNRTAPPRSLEEAAHDHHHADALA